MNLDQSIKQIKRKILYATCANDLANYYWTLSEDLIDTNCLEAANRAQLISLKIEPRRIDKTLYQHTIAARKSAGRNEDVKHFVDLLKTLDILIKFYL